MPSLPISVLRRPLADLPDPLPIPCLAATRGRAPFDIHVRPPGSKSLTNRALLLAALADGVSTLRRPLLDADDAERMIDALEQLGARIDRAGPDLRIRGVGGRWRVPDGGVELNLNNAGTATRFLAAAAALAPGPVTIDGNTRMRQRPIGQLVDALRQLGLRAEHALADGYPPVRLDARAGLQRSASIEIPTTLSSQFISALLLVAPWLPGGLTVALTGPITSRSYIAMTVGLLDLLGASVKTSDDLRIIRIGPRPVAPFDYTVEPDASGATYFWAAAAMTPGAVCRVEGLGRESLQGDARFPELLARAGAPYAAQNAAGPSTIVRGPAALAPVMADLADMPDAAMTLAAVASFATGRSVLRGLATLRVKETDRIAALQNELAKVGVRVDAGVLGDPGAITIDPPPRGVDCSARAPRVEFDTYDDHRMAMALALIGLRRPNVLVRNPRCVGKTYPGFWSDLARLY